MSTFEDALVEGKLHVDGRPVVDWEWDRTTGRVELFLAADWEVPENGGNQ
ncbi:hypothetical protein [Nocardia sp. NPDC049707]